MAIIEPSLRSQRYENRCLKKKIAEQKKERNIRYENREKNNIILSIKQEVRDELNQKSNSHYNMRKRENTLRYGVLGSYF